LVDRQKARKELKNPLLESTHSQQFSLKLRAEVARNARERLARHRANLRRTTAEKRLLRLRQGTKEQLIEFAKREHRSLNQQIEFILEHFLSDTSHKQRNVPSSDEGGD
jgi:hypothetical protein